jgi:hypothetical protein
MFKKLVIIFSVLFAIIIIILIVLFIYKNHEEKKIRSELIGSWINLKDENYSVILSEDKTVREEYSNLIETNGTWSLDTGYPFNQEDDVLITIVEGETYKYGLKIKEGKKLTLVAKDGSDILEFKRQ